MTHDAMMFMLIFSTALAPLILIAVALIVDLINERKDK